MKKLYLKNLISKYRHVGIIVKDMNKAIDFYCNLLGHKIIVDFIEEEKYFGKLIGIKDSKARIVKATAPDGVFVELIQFLSHNLIESSSNEFNIRGRSHICFTVDDIQKVYEKLRANGIKFVSEPLKSSYDPAISCFCYDPDNTLVQFVQILDPNNMMVK